MASRAGSFSGVGFRDTEASKEALALIHKIEPGNDEINCHDDANH